MARYDKEKNTELISSLKKGALKDLVNIVRESDDLILCLRLQAVDVYYCGHVILHIELTATDDTYRISMDKKHLKCTKDYNDLMEQNGIVTYGNRVGFEINNNQKVDWISKIFIFQKYMDDFFSMSMNFNYIESKVITRKLKYIEKKRQQRIFNANQNITNGLCMIDFEYTESGNSHAQFDLVGILFKENEPYDIIVMELKSTPSAFADSNGVNKHKKDMDKFCNDSKEKNQRVNAFIDLYNDYVQIGMLNAVPLKKNDIIDIKALFVFSDEVKNYPKNSRKCINTNAKYIVMEDDKIDVINLNNGDIKIM